MKESKKFKRFASACKTVAYLTAFQSKLGETGLFIEDEDHDLGFMSALSSAVDTALKCIKHDKQDTSKIRSAVIAIRWESRDSEIEYIWKEYSK